MNSPFGRVLQAIRENPFRAEALGYRTVIHRTLANVIAAAVAAAVGALNALWLRYTGPDTSLSFAIMLDILLIVVIGGMGTMYGAIVGGTLFILAQNYLQALMGTVSTAAGEAGIPLLPQLLHPDRWLLWLGILFIASVYFFPTGIVGKLRGGPELDATPSKGMPHDTRAAAERLAGHPDPCIRRDGGIRAWPRAVRRAERHAAAPDHRMDLGHPDGGNRDQLILDS